MSFYRRTYNNIRIKSIRYQIVKMNMKVNVKFNNKLLMDGIRRWKTKYKQLSILNV